MDAWVLLSQHTQEKSGGSPGLGQEVSRAFSLMGVFLLFAPKGRVTSEHCGQPGELEMLAGTRAGFLGGPALLSGR